MRRCFVTAVLLAAAFAVFAELGLSFLSREVVLEAARGYVLSCVHQAVGEELEKNGTEYISVKKTADGLVREVSADANALNGLRSAVLKRLEKSLNGRAAVRVPAGSLTGLRVLSGRGPGVPVRLKLEGSADVSFQSEFDPAGLNQSRHRITMTVRVRAVTESRTFSARVEESSSTVLAETVVVGETPGTLFAAVP